MSGHSMPMSRLWVLLKPLASALGRKFYLRISFSTRSRFSALTDALWVMTLETVAVDTFASRAMSLMVMVCFSAMPLHPFFPHQAHILFFSSIIR